MDVNTALRVAVEKKAVAVGFNKTKKLLEKNLIGVVVAASNCSLDCLKIIEKYQVSIYRYEGTNAQLGVACGKPFPISTLGISGSAGSDILQALKTQGRK